MRDTRNFYDELATDYHLLFESWDDAVRAQGAHLDGLLGPDTDPVLDLAAGMGTQAIGLALRGREVVARDLSPRFVERGRREAARLGATLAFEIGDMREQVPTDAGRFGAVVAFDNSLPHLTDDRDLVSALAAARAALRPGGRFLASIRDYDTLGATRPTLDPPRVLGEPPERRIILQAWRWDDDGKHYDLDHLILREAEGWATHLSRGRYRALLRAELDACAREAGLISLTWLLPADTGHYQPIFSAHAP